MNTIIVHTPQNEASRTYRYYNYFWEDFIKLLETKFFVKQDTYYEYANMKSYSVKLLNDVSCSELLECEMIIENEQTKQFVIMSVSDCLTGAILNHQSNELCQKVLVAQFDEQNILAHLLNKNNISKYSPWIYFPSNKFDLDAFYQARKSKTDLIDKFCFWGTSLEDRAILSHFNSEVFDGGRPIGDFNTYASVLTQYKVALSIAGRGEFCYRDIENFGMGVPIIRFEYKNKMAKPLIPNFHYISAGAPEDLIYDRMGQKHHAEMIEHRFNQVKDDKDFLKFISENARQYYIDNLNTDSSVQLTYNLLQLHEWE